jgi:hypothetical protein
MTTNAKISALILANLAAGMTLPQAIDAVLGAGTYERTAGEVYDTLCAKVEV